MSSFGLGPVGARRPLDGPADTGTVTVRLPIEGMTCAACANRIERRLNKIDGVSASVNYAIEEAAVSVEPSAGVDRERLVAEVVAAGYGVRRRGRANLSDRTRLVVCALLAAPVLVLSMVTALQFDYWQWVCLVCATPVVVWGALPFHGAALANLRHRAATMDTLVSLGVTAAFSWSLWALVAGGAGDPTMRMDMALWPGSHAHAVDAGAGSQGETGESEPEIYLEVAAGVVVFLLAGRAAEARSKRDAGAALRALLARGAKHATVVSDGVERRVPAHQVRVGDTVVVRPGEIVAVDGVVIDGSSAVDMSMLTGESVPVDVAEGSSVAGGTVNVDGRLFVRATRVGAETAHARIARLVTEAQAGKAPVQRLADRVSAVFVPAVIVVAAATFTWWIVAGASVGRAVEVAVAVLIVACPCALGLATPTALLVGTGRGAQLGIVIRGPEVLESTRRIDTVVLDKTGTVTTGDMTLVDVIVAGRAGSPSGDEVLAAAAALEQASEHPVAAAIVRGAGSRPPGTGRVDGFRNIGGAGVVGRVDGVEVLVGRRDYLVDTGARIDDELVAAANDAEGQGRTVVGVAWNGEVHGVLAVADVVKESSVEAVRELVELGMRPVLLTGDNPTVADAIAAQVGISEVIAGVGPEEKVAVVDSLQRTGAVVAMVGDGVNDAAALVQADLGIALGTGTDVAMEAADITLVSGDLRAAADAVRLSRRTLAVIKGNLFWAFAYNVAAIPLAAVGALNPLIAGAAMAMSSLFVVTNSLRLRRFGVSRPAVRTG